jgi:hypothetical protein
MKVIQEGKTYSRIQLSLEEIKVIYFALMTQIAHTLIARQRTSVDATQEVLAAQLEVELDLSEEFDKLANKELIKYG